MKKLLMLLASSILIQANAQKANTDNRLQGLDAELQKVLQQWKAAGFAVAVIEKDRIVYERGFGLRSVDSKEAITPNTLFAIGSCTKAFTATLVGMLANDGKLSLDEPVRQYLPELAFYNNDMNNLITLRDMMSHRTGLPRHDLSWYLSPTSRDSLVMRIRYQEPTARPKEKWQYNNFMFLAQGSVVEKVSGQSWESNMREKIFRPLGMSRSNMPYPAVQNDADVATPHDYNKDSSLKTIPHYNVGQMGPAGSVYSSVHEMAQWVKAWIHGGKVDTLQVLPAAYCKDAISSQMVAAAGVPDSAHPDIQFSTYGLGWFLGSYKGHYRVEHGGAIDGFIASTCFFPTDSIGIIVLSNQGVRQIPAIVRNIISDRMLKLSRTDWNKESVEAVLKAKKQTEEAKSNVTIERVTGTAPSHKLRAYEGLYQHPGYGTMEVYLKNDSLFAKTALYTIWLEHWNYDAFVPYIGVDREAADTSERPGIRMIFETNSNGSIDGFKAIGFEAPSIDIRFKRKEKPAALTREELQGYTGEYALGPQTVKVYLSKEDILTIEVPGQQPYALVPVGNHKFQFKILQGFSVQFDKETGKPASAASFIQPNGTFKATRK